MNREPGPGSCGAHRHIVDRRGPLSLVALVGTRLNPVLKALYAHLLAARKPSKVALMAYTHELLAILNAIAGSGSSGSTGIAGVV